MRLGAYPAVLRKGSMAERAYGATKISERHRHRFEVNPAFIKKIEKAGMVFSGQSPDRRLMEVMELPREQHPFFKGSQFHPELTSRPLKPNPLFREFLASASSRASVPAKAGVSIFGMDANEKASMAARNRLIRRRAGLRPVTIKTTNNATAPTQGPRDKGAIKPPTSNTMPERRMSFCWMDRCINKYSPMPTTII